MRVEFEAHGSQAVGINVITGVHPATVTPLAPAHRAAPQFQPVAAPPVTTPPYVIPSRPRARAAVPTPTYAAAQRQPLQTQSQVPEPPPNVGYWDSVRGPRLACAAVGAVFVLLIGAAASTILWITARLNGRHVMEHPVSFAFFIAPGLLSVIGTVVMFILVMSHSPAEKDFVKKAPGTAVPHLSANLEADRTSERESATQALANRSGASKQGTVFIRRPRPATSRYTRDGMTANSTR